MKTSEFIYGPAANNRHGDLNQAIEAGVITAEEARRYTYVTRAIMAGQRFQGDYPDETQFKLDNFFYRLRLDYWDFHRQCQALSGDRWVTVCARDLFEKGVRCYYTDEGKTVTVPFTSRFDVK